MALPVFIRNWMIFISVFPISSQTVDYNRILDDYDRFNANYLQPDVFRHHKFLYYPRQPISNSHLVPVNIKSLIGINKSYKINLYSNTNLDNLLWERICYQQFGRTQREIATKDQQ